MDKGKEPERAEVRMTFIDMLCSRFANAISLTSLHTCPQGASYLRMNTDDDDITAFMQEIEVRRPIGGGFNSRHDRERTVSDVGAVGGRPVFAGLTDGQEHQRRSRTISESGRGVGLAGYRAARGDVEGAGIRVEPTLHEVSEPPTRQASASSGLALGLDVAPGPDEVPDPVAIAERLEDQSTIDERLKALQDKYNTSMEGIMRRRESGPGSSATATAGPSTLLDPPLSGGLQRMRPSGSPLRPVPETSALGHARRVASTPGGPVSIRDEFIPPGLRRRTDSGSGASAASASAGGFYGQGRAARGSAASVSGASIGSEEPVGRLEMDR